MWLGKQRMCLPGLTYLDGVCQHPRDISAFYFIFYFIFRACLSLSTRCCAHWQMGLMHHKEDLKNSFLVIYIYIFSFFFRQLSFSLQSKGPVVWEEATKTNPSRKTEKQPGKKKTSLCQWLETSMCFAFISAPILAAFCCIYRLDLCRRCCEMLAGAFPTGLKDGAGLGETDPERAEKWCTASAMVPPEGAEMLLAWTRRPHVVSPAPWGHPRVCSATLGPLVVPSRDVPLFFPCEHDIEPNRQCDCGLHTLPVVTGFSMCFKPLTVPFKY